MYVFCSSQGGLREKISKRRIHISLLHIQQALPEIVARPKSIRASQRNYVLGWIRKLAVFSACLYTVQYK